MGGSDCLWHPSPDKPAELTALETMALLTDKEIFHIAHREDRYGSGTFTLCNLKIGGAYWNETNRDRDGRYGQYCLHSYDWKGESAALWISEPSRHTWAIIFCPICLLLIRSD